MAAGVAEGGGMSLRDSNPVLAERKEVRNEGKSAARRQVPLEENPYAGDDGWPWEVQPQKSAGASA